MFLRRRWFRRAAVRGMRAPSGGRRGRPRSLRDHTRRVFPPQTNVDSGWRQPQMCNAVRCAHWGPGTATRDESDAGGGGAGGSGSSPSWRFCSSRSALARAPRRGRRLRIATRPSALWRAFPLTCRPANFRVPPAGGRSRPSAAPASRRRRSHARAVAQRALVAAGIAAPRRRGAGAAVLVLRGPARRWTARPRRRSRAAGATRALAFGVRVASRPSSRTSSCVPGRMGLEMSGRADRGAAVARRGDLSTRTLGASARRTS